MFAPLGVGRHVDHLLARSVGERLRPCCTPTSPTPPATRDARGRRGRGLRPWAWTADLAAKPPVIAGYRTQVDALFPGGEIPLRPETYYAGRRPDRLRDARHRGDGVGRSRRTASLPSAR